MFDRFAFAIAACVIGSSRVPGQAAGSCPSAPASGQSGLKVAGAPRACAIDDADDALPRRIQYTVRGRILVLAPIPALGAQTRRGLYRARVVFFSPRLFLLRRRGGPWRLRGAWRRGAGSRASCVCAPSSGAQTI